jgi:UDP-N-acetylmuramate dehydrogenase
MGSSLPPPVELPAAAGESQGGTALASDARARLHALLGGAVCFDEPLSRHTSMRVGGPAGAWVQLGDIAKLAAVLQLCQTEGIAWTVIGLGSNLLVRDEGFAGVVMRLGGEFAKIRIDGCRLRAGSAVPIASLCRDAAKAGLRGAEALAGIPGTVGGAVRMNAGTDVEIGPLLESVEVLVPGDAGPQSVRLQFSYRRSTLERSAIVCAAQLRLEPGDPRATQAEVRRRIDRRGATQPIELPNLGSIFKNPPGDHAARLIETAGCKGKRAGGAEVSVKHANFIVNRGGATCRDVLELIAEVRASVLAVHGVALELEIHLL